MLQRLGGSELLKLSVGMLVSVRILGDFDWGLGKKFEQNQPRSLSIPPETNGEHPCKSRVGR